MDAKNFCNEYHDYFDVISLWLAKFDIQQDGARW